jgi:type IX secretion system PorP/SprF family membrane protein
MKKIILLLWLNAALVACVHAQTDMPVYRQFLFNPYLQNAAFVGANKQSTLSMFYKKQWMGVTGAPSTVGISIQVPTQKKVSLGVNIISDNQVVLKNTALSGTFGYAVPISEEGELRFGISGGVSVNRFDFTADELNTNDPAFLKASGNRYHYDGNFGLAYKRKALTVGVALTELFESDPFLDQSFNKFSMQSLKNRLVSVSYRLALDHFDQFVAEPYVLYKQTTQHKNDYWDGGAMIYYQKKIWTGVSYNSTLGLALHFGTEFLNAIRFSYTYEFPSFSSAGVNRSSQELHLQVMFSKIRK